MSRASERRYQSPNGMLVVRLAAPGVAVIELSGRDTGQFGQAPFEDLQALLSEYPGLELFIDARHGQGATIDVSAEWAAWLAANKASFRHVSMLTGSRFIQLSAEFVRRFAELGAQMRIYADPAVFDGALAHATANARRA